MVVEVHFERKKALETRNKLFMSENNGQLCAAAAGSMDSERERAIDKAYEGLAVQQETKNLSIEDIDIEYETSSAAGSGSTGGQKSPQECSCSQSI